MFVALSVGFASCGDDDENGDVSETGLVGTWESTYIKGWYKNSEQPELNEEFDEPTTGSDIRQFTFKANGTGDEKGNPFTWTLKGNTTLIAIDGEDEALIAGKILNLTDKELIVGESVNEGTETSYLETTYKRIK